MAHLAALGLVCPACRVHGRAAPRLEVRTVLHTETTRAGADLLEGVLVCPACLREHPVIDGIVVAVADIAGWAEHQLDAVLRRHDLSPVLESLLGDVVAPGASFDRERHELSTYVGAHWSDREVGAEVAAPGTFAHLCAAALGMLPASPAGAWLDVGCAAGRGTFQLAAAGAEVAIGVDLNMAMLRRAEQARRTGQLAWPRRRVGQVFDVAVAEVGGLPRERVGFVCADASALPFADGRFAGGLSLNLLDCVAAPVQHLVELGRVLAPGGAALLSTPYDWSVSATPMERWIGGHSQRGEQRGASEPELRRILSADAAAGVDTGLTVADERAAVPWRLPLTARATMDYQVHLLRLLRA